LEIHRPVIHVLGNQELSNFLEIPTNSQMDRRQSICSDSVKVSSFARNYFQILQMTVSSRNVHDRPTLIRPTVNVGAFGNEEINCFFSPGRCSPMQRGVTRMVSYIYFGALS
jgi:hypothetical protein